MKLEIDFSKLKMMSYTRIAFTTAGVLFAIAISTCGAPFWAQCLMWGILALVSAGVNELSKG